MLFKMCWLNFQKFIIYQVMKFNSSTKVNSATGLCSAKQTDIRFKDKLLFYFDANVDMAQIFI